jgi:hypothetical protein
VGIHPHEALTASEEAFREIEELSRHPKVVAIGEIGLDFHYDFAPRQIQEEVFRKTVPLSEFGTAADVLKIPPQFPLGTYTVKMAPEGVAVAGGAPPARAVVEEGDPEEELEDEGAPTRVDTTGAVTTAFEVQEVRPPRHFTSVRFRKNVRKDESYVNLARETAVLEAEIHGSYYAGSGVKNGKDRWKIACERIATEK